MLARLCCHCCVLINSILVATILFLFLVHVVNVVPIHVTMVVHIPVRTPLVAGCTVHACTGHACPNMLNDKLNQMD